MINIDEQLHNADWYKFIWILPEYKSDKFYLYLERQRMLLSDFKKLPVYINAVERGLIRDDKWIGE